MNTSFSIVNVCAGQHSAGSPTPVCFSAESLTPEEMRSIAGELALPVTAFVWPQEGAARAIRYFTPLTEIGACGHATLAAAALLSARTSAMKILFQTRDGSLIPASVDNGRVTMTYPALSVRRFALGNDWLQILKVDRVVRSFYCAPLETLFLHLQTEDDVAKAAPDFQRLFSVAGDTKEVVITAAADGKNYDYVLRSFCPWIGIDEDPVTGSVHAALAPYWATNLGKTTLRARQASESGGEIHLTVGSQKVRIGGDCVFVPRSEPVGQRSPISPLPVSVNTTPKTPQRNFSKRML